jgi:hypothetical protein
MGAAYGGGKTITIACPMRAVSAFVAARQREQKLESFYIQQSVIDIRSIVIGLQASCQRMCKPFLCKAVCWSPSAVPRQLHRVK